jgi:hypothetical protein
MELEEIIKSEIYIFLKEECNINESKAIAYTKSFFKCHLRSLMKLKNTIDS